jgi:Protein of unknown function (DUF2817)
MYAPLFAASYAEARQRFGAAARAAGARLHSYALDGTTGAGLAIDVAILGAADDPTLLISSGLHGVEGFFGSAVQLALLQQPPVQGLRCVLIHALNPYGFAHLRRVNEDNVDLNRNFVHDGSRYAGAPEGYAGLDAFLNPPSAPPRFDAFRLKALGTIRRMGLHTLKDAVAGGQHEFPRGLFFGGNRACAATRIVQQHCDAWLDASPCVIHIDLHTGLGAYARPTLLLNESKDGAHYAWYADTFGVQHIEPLAQAGGTAYRATGTFGQWMQQHFSASDYRFVGAEFGTYNIIRVLAALRAENRAHHHCAPADADCQRAKAQLTECFCPRAPAWREASVSAAVHLIQRAAAALTRHAP